MKRLFIATDISDEARAAASEIIQRLRKAHPVKGIFWAKPQNLHVTIKFLGDTDDEIVPQLIGSITKIASQFPTFALRLDGPELLGKRVMSIKIGSDTPTIFDLEKRMDTECESLGFKREGRRFHPHLTLARIRDPRSAGALPREFCNTQIEPVAFDVREIVLYESRLTPSGSVYTSIGTSAFVQN